MSHRDEHPGRFPAIVTGTGKGLSSKMWVQVLWATFLGFLLGSRSLGGTRKKSKGRIRPASQSSVNSPSTGLSPLTCGQSTAKAFPAEPGYQYSTQPRQPTFERQMKNGWFPTMLETWIHQDANQAILRPLLEEMRGRVASYGCLRTGSAWCVRRVAFDKLSYVLKGPGNKIGGEGYPLPYSHWETNTRSSDLKSKERMQD